MAAIIFTKRYCANARKLRVQSDPFQCLPCNDGIYDRLTERFRENLYRLTFELNNLAHIVKTILPYVTTYLQRYSFAKRDVTRHCQMIQFN